MRLKTGKIIIIMIINLIVIIVGLIQYPYYNFKPIHSDDNIKNYELGLQVAFIGIFVDFKKNFYMGFDTGIYCYSPSGEYLYKLVTPNSLNIPAPYDFSISDDILTVWTVRSNNKNLYTLSGDFISNGQYEDSELPFYRTSFDRRKAWQNGKILYRYHSIFGFWWVTNETGQCLTHIPVFMFILKICLILEFICLWMLLGRLYNFCLKNQR